MSVVVRNKTVFPSLVSKFFKNETLFPSFLDFDGDLLNVNGGSLSLPNANIIENSKDYKIELAAPGLERKDFKVEVDNGVLSISAEKEEEKKEEHKNYRRREFSYNSFSRAFTLPDNCIADKIEAKYEGGILNISVPKKEASITKPVKEIKVD